MAAPHRLPRTLADWLRVFGPGAIMASLTIGTGELIFSSRGGAIFGERILLTFVVILLLKWGLVFATARHMVLTGVHPYERMLELPGPRGWLPIMLLLLAVVCLPIWVSFHSGVVGNLTSWLTGTRSQFNGGMDYIWGGAILAATLLLSATGGYRALERVQIFVVLAMVFCSGLTLALYRPDWLQILLGLLPRPLQYPDWLPVKYPEIARQSVWVETTRYVGVIGGAGFDYLAYVSWLREKSWGALPGRATTEQLHEAAADPHHELRKWITAPLLDSAISFLMVAAFSAVFVVSGAMFLRPGEIVPDESNLLNLQARFVTQIHPWLLPLYATGACLTMIGTLYGTVEVACGIADEILRLYAPQWTAHIARRVRRLTLVWCASAALLILGWLFLRQAAPAADAGPSATSGLAAAAANGSAAIADSRASPDSLERDEIYVVPKPRLLLAILTPVNLLTGVLSCGLICWLAVWMDYRWLPPGLRPPLWLTAMNAVSGFVFLAIGWKGYWDNENRTLAVSGILIVLAGSLIVAWAVRSRRPGQSPDAKSFGAEDGQ